jgi:apolipoprotein N-acyltransferase
MKHSPLSAKVSLSLAAQALAAQALAQANPTAMEPTLGERLGGWAPFLLVLVVAIVIYVYRRRRAGDVDPAAPTGTRLDPEH